MPVSVAEYVTALWTRCVAAVRSVSGDRGDRRSSAEGSLATHGSDGDAGDPTLLVYGQTLWMAVTLALLFALSLLSVRLYFVVSFIGLLCNRVLFAPRAATARWWRVVNVITWLCFAVLSYVVYLRIRASVPAPA